MTADLHFPQICVDRSIKRRNWVSGAVQSRGWMSYVSDSIGYVQSFIPSKVQNVFKRIVREVIELRPETFHLAECIVVSAIGNKYVTLGWTVLHTLSGGQKIIHQIEGSGVVKTALQIVLLTYVTRQVSATFLQVPSISRPCVGGVNEVIRPSLNCLMAGNRVADCAAQIDESYISHIIVVTRQYGQVLIVSTNPSSTSARFFAMVNTTTSVAEVCFNGMKQDLTVNATKLDPIMLGNMFNQLADGRSMVYVEIKPRWPWDFPCAFIHERAADLDLGNEMTCAFIDHRSENRTRTFCFNPDNPSTVRLMRLDCDAIARFPRREGLIVYPFRPGNTIRLMDYNGTVEEADDHTIC